MIKVFGGLDAGEPGTRNHEPGTKDLRSGGNYGFIYAMMFRTYKPGPPLSDFVVLLWLYEGYHQPHAKERVLPDGSMELVINLRDDVFRVYDRQNHNQFTTVPGYLLS